MANNNEVPVWRQWLSEKLNPAQPSIAAKEPFASPSSIVAYENAYKDIEVVINTKTGLVDRYRIGGVDFVGKGAFEPIVMKDIADSWRDVELEE